MASFGWQARLAAVLLLAIGAAACGDDNGTTGDEPVAPPPEDAAAFQVETFSETLVDETRPTDDPRGDRSAPSRTLATDVYVPEGDGPFPLIVHAHGFDGNAGKYTNLLTAWAEAGYVVAAPTFPLTNDVDDGRGVFDDVNNQPADVGFVIDELLDLAAGDHPHLAGRIDDQRIGLSGHSLGGVTAYGLVFNSCCRDDRITALIVMAGEPLDLDGGSYDFDDTPLLLMLATDDRTVRHDNASTVYEEVTGPRVLVTMEGNGHFEPYEDVASPHDDVVVATTAAFWDAYLRDDPDATGRLVDAVEADDLTTVTAEP